jgi:hypothetical protein
MQEILDTVQATVNPIYRELRGSRPLGERRHGQQISEPQASLKSLILKGLIGGPDRDRTDDLFHAIVPTLGFSITYKGNNPVDAQDCRGV